MLKFIFKIAKSALIFLAGVLVGAMLMAMVMGFVREWNTPSADIDVQPTSSYSQTLSQAAYE